MGYELKWEAKGVTKFYFGQLTAHDLMRSLEAVEADPRFDEIRFVINDFLSIEGLELEGFNVDHVCAIDAAAFLTNPRIRVAIVALDAEIIAHGRHYAASPMNSYPTRLFSTVEGARTWLASPA